MPDADATTIQAQDTFLIQSLLTFLKAQHQLYLETMTDDPRVADVQARYEVSSVALRAIAYHACKLEPTDELPEKWQSVLMLINSLICETGDEWLISQGFNPEDL